MKLTLRVDHDQDVESPTNYDGWKLYSFSSRHSNYKHPNDVGLSLRVVDGDPVVESPGLRRKLERGLAFVLSYFEHGSCVWSLKGSGPQCPWDTAQIAGLLVWESNPKDLGPKTPEERREDAKRFLATYTAWCNGETYWYDLKDEDGEHVDSCGGYIGPDLDGMWESIAAAVGENELDFEDSQHGDADGLRREWEKFQAKRAQPA